jgi:hypothetical protein
VLRREQERRSAFSDFLLLAAEARNVNAEARRGARTVGEFSQRMKFWLRAQSALSALTAGGPPRLREGRLGPWIEVQV